MLSEFLDAITNKELLILCKFSASLKQFVIFYNPLQFKISQQFYLPYYCLKFAFCKRI